VTALGCLSGGIGRPARAELFRSFVGVGFEQPPSSQLAIPWSLSDSRSIACGGVSGTISATGGRPPSRFALRWTTFDDARLTRLANRSRERSERLAKVGGASGIRPPSRLRRYGESHRVSGAIHHSSPEL